MDVLPLIRTAPPSAAREFYQAYLNSADWRSRRNRALKLADWCCQRCASRRELEVHHNTYERLGREWDSDLDVLCFNCHRGEHLDRPEQTSLGVYLKLASEAVRKSPFDSIANLSESMKRRCVELQISVVADRVHAALAVVCGNRLQTEPPRRQQQVNQGRGLTKEEARELWCRLDIAGLAKHLPSRDGSPEALRAHEQKVRRQADEFRGSAPRETRRSPLERLAAIFTGEGQ